MAVAESTAKECPSAAEGSKQGERKEKPLAKVVVRRLPPTMDRAAFLLQVSPVPDHDYFYFVRGDLSLGEHAFSRAYINFSCPEDIFVFKEKFDNYVFLDDKGAEYVAVVEFASFQRIPKKKGKIKVDAKVDTVESDPAYLEFVESLSKTEEPSEEKPEYSFQPNQDSKKAVVSTPLLEYVKQKHLDRQRSRGEKREEKKRKVLEKRRFKDEERRRRQDAKGAAQPSFPELDERREEEAEAKSAKPSKAADEKKPAKHKSNYERHGLAKRQDYKAKREEPYYKSKAADAAVVKKVKKYSERREERKLEAKKAELRKSEGKAKDGQEGEDAGSEAANDQAQGDKPRRNKENDPRLQRRIRNKDRPSLQIYQPGMLKNRKPTEDAKKPASQEEE